jgi:NADPH:quinone reductase
MEIENSKKFVFKYFENQRIPTIDENELLVKVFFCSTKGINTEVIEGKYPLFTKHDSVPGYEITGTVESFGSQVTKFKKNDKVISILPLDCLYGGFGEYCVVKAWNTVSLTDKINMKNITGSIFPGIRAYQSLFFGHKIGKGDNVLIVNGASITQNISLQYAINQGSSVFTTLSNDEDLNILKNFNCHMIDLRKNELENISKEIQELGFSVVVDDGTLNLESISKYLGIGSSYFSSNPQALTKMESNYLLFKNVKIGFLFEHGWILSNSHQGNILC